MVIQEKNFDFLVKKRKLPVKTRASKKRSISFAFKMPKIPNMPKLKLPRMPKVDIAAIKKINFSEISLSSYSKFSVKKQTFFAKRLSFLIKAGVPMLESMYVLRKQTKSKAEIKVLTKVIADVSNGQSLSTSMGRFKGVFGDFAINIIKAGESSGTLMQNLTYLADELKKKEILRKKILSALLYPVIVTCATFGITGMLIVYIFPKILPIFQSLKAQLPLSTRIIIFLSQVVRSDGIYIFIGLVILSSAIFFINKKFPKFRFFFHGLILKVPFTGSIAQNYNLTNTTRTLGLLLKSGLSLTESLAITSDTTENLQYKKAYDDVGRGVLKGKSISEVICQTKTIFPDMLEHMVSVGEKSGNLSNTLIYLSEYYENEFDDQTKNLSSSIEPVLMIVMGILVGFVAISIITPIYGITQHLSPK